MARATDTAKGLRARGGEGRALLLRGALATSTACAVLSLGAQEPDPAIPPPPLPGAPFGMSAAPPEAAAPLSFATQDGQPAPVAVPLLPPPPTPSSMAPPPSQAIPMRPIESNVGGVSVSDPMERSRVITSIRPERVPVYPGDPESAYWEINPSYAFARAQREQRPMLLLFTGMWSAQAMSLSEEVFATRSFNDYVKDHLVICYLNFERNITDNPDALRRLKDRFNVRGYPNLLIFNPNGEVESAIRGYRSGRPVDYFNRLKAACQPVLESVAQQKASMLPHGYRDWSNYLGREIFAKFLEHDGRYVRLGDLSGRDWLLPINDLSPDDQRLVESFPAMPEFEIEEAEEG